MRLLQLAVISFALLGLGACASSDDTRADHAAEEVDTLYNRAAAQLDEGNYALASRNFEEVERQHPYSQWATQAQLMAGYSYYKGELYEEAIIALDRFMELHPGHKNVDYAHYLKALCFYEQISDVRRDQQLTKDAVDAFDALIRRFPDSKYARDAVLKKDLTLDHLAGKEMEIGRYYLNGGHVNAAINRFRAVVQQYQTTTHVPEALHRLVEAYLTLGLNEEATKVAAVLGHNYPGSVWYEKTYDLLDPQARERLIDDRGFIDKTVESIFSPE